MKDYNVKVTIFDPWANSEEVAHEYGFVSQKEQTNKKFDAVLLTVAHNEFKEIDFTALKKENAVVYDVKNVLDKSLKDKTL